MRERGQVTIPALVRRQAGIEEGATVEFEVTSEGVLLRPSLVVDPVVDDAFARQVIAETTEGFALLRADADSWAEELVERSTLDGSLADGLKEA